MPVPADTSPRPAWMNELSVGRTSSSLSGTVSEPRARSSVSVERTVWRQNATNGSQPSVVPMHV